MVQQIPPTGLSNNIPFRNYIINGDMSIWQRATSATAVSNGSYSACDRWHFPFYSTSGAMTTEREALSVADQATTGMYYCNLLKCTTADTSVAADSIIQMRQTIEAQNCQPFNYGTSDAKTLTLSFYAKANASKTYGVSLWKRDSTAYYWFQDISVTTSWQRFEIVISPTAGSTSLITSSNGAIANDNGEGLEVSFVLASGSNYQATADTWTSNQDFNTSNLDNFLSSTDNTFRVTGVQLEIGSGSTDFEHLPHDVNLRRCMRYYTRYDASEGYTRYASGFINSSTAAVAIMQLPVPMRGVPSIDHSGTAGDYSIYHGTTTTPCNTTPQLQVPSTGDDNATSVGLQLDVSSGLTAGQGCIFLGTNANTNNFFAFASEL